MHIVFLARRAYPYIGGVEKHVIEVGRRLVAKGHSVVIITEFVRREKNLPVMEQYEGMDIYRIPIRGDEKRKKWEIWQWLWQHRECIQKADIIHAHDVFYWYLPFRFLYPWKKVYTTFHGYEGYPIRWQAIVIRKFVEIFSQKIICVGDFMKKWYFARPDVISYGGVKKVSHKNSMPDPYSAVFWGRLDDQTGILTYQEAADIIGKKYTQFSLTVLGEGELSKKINQNIKLLPFTEDITQYLQTARFAFVSRYLSILEALAAKRLVFALYDNPVKKDYLTMAPFSPFIIIENSAEELAKKVIEIMKNPQQEKEMVEKGYKWVERQTWDHVVTLYEKIWDINNKQADEAK